MGMTHEEAIKRLEDTFEAWDTWVKKCPEDAPARLLNEALGMAIAALREQPRWISVEERLPERGVKVLCYMNFLQSEETKNWGTCVTENTYNGMFVGSGYRKPVWEWQSDFVTHWMPLPEPPKEEV